MCYMNVEDTLIGMDIDKALNLLKNKNKEIKITYNNSDKLKDYDSQLVVAYIETDKHIELIVSSFKVGVNK